MSCTATKVGHDYNIFSKITVRSCFLVEGGDMTIFDGKGASDDKNKYNFFMGNKVLNII